MQMKNGWTRGQFRIFRVTFGLYLLYHFLSLLPWGPELFSSKGVLPKGTMSPLFHLFPNLFLLCDSPLFVQACLLVAAIFSLFLTVGKFDRVMAILVWYFWACLYGRNPLIGNPSLPFIGWMLLAYVLIPSLSDRKELSSSGEDTGSWKMPADIFAAAWILMAVAYSYSGYCKLISPSWVDGTALRHVLTNPLARDTVVRALLLALPALCLKAATWAGLFLELAFAPLALFRRLRPFLWLAMVGLHLGLLVLVNFSDLTIGMLMLHFFTFDPAWIPSPKPAGQPIFYDGHCGLCHGLVRFVLSEDQSAHPFSFAPLQGEQIKRSIADDVRSELPDSVVVVEENKNVLTRSTAVIYVLKRLGGLWFFVAALLSLVPRGLRDLAYDAIASVRKKIFGTTEEVCPLVPSPLRARFLG
ncbi:MAG TPA: DCC1-like thiol-disulfide oxidoreductase family protein [Candidatus Acidoferrum sp.]|jgi:predicted DCC family thiol-disulfide oxidoreductase YuxK|nr:DCC1-like thiol-disulfide oxidoreductase family protein [Candidatus Acidoferrum sp.]